ncbi:LuxR C-terminal-related transcriptional regulator [Amycolatopsis sp. NPDC048633]|uniref:ATP-binding protein n=1 Tax=Amycolatopsis sp. NPDC048633 TaxID=3157095 RepID=UPI003403D16C
MPALPAEVTSFVGRRRELSETRRLLSAGRLVTLTGTGGVGKTRLAVRAAAQVHRMVPDGAWLIELATVRDPDLVAPTVGAALGLRDTGGDPVAGLTAFLRDKRLLLVLDNCEHLGRSCAELVHELLTAAPGLRILTTSRHVLGVEGEHVFPVPPLAVPEVRDFESAAGLDVVALFADRAAAVSAGFAVDRANWPQVVQVCRRLDGIPLAVELAAGWLRVLGVDELLDRLDDFFALLARGSTVAPARHRTLAGAVAWSYDLCTPAERRLWTRLPVFAGGFDLAAVEAVCDAGEHVGVLDLVAGLVDSSVVQVASADGVPRFHLLEPVRQYALAKLRESGEEDLVRQRHRDHYLAVAGQAEHGWRHGPDQAGAAARLRREGPNIRVALEYCLSTPGQEAAGLRLGVSCRLQWLFFGQVTEGRRWLERALALNPGPSRDRVRALWIVASARCFMGEAASAVELAEEVEAWARAHDDESELAHAQLVLGGCHFFSGDVGRAATLFRAAADRLEAAGERSSMLFQCLSSLAQSFAWRGDLEEALATADRGLALSDRTGEQFSRTTLRYVRGLTLWRLGRPAEASRELVSALRHARPFTDVLGVVKSVEVLAWATADLRRPERAAELLGVAHAVWPLLGAAPLFGFPQLIEAHEECVAEVVRALGAARYDTAFAHGASAAGDLVQAVDAALGEAQPQPPAHPPELSEREYEVARLVAEGLTNKDIALRLVISRRTAESHVAHILAKLGFGSRAQIATWLARRGTSG